MFDRLWMSQNGARGSQDCTGKVKKGLRKDESAVKGEESSSAQITGTVTKNLTAVSLVVLFCSTTVEGPCVSAQSNIGLLVE
jgi:hypothetical protein